MLLTIDQAAASLAISRRTLLRDLLGHSSLAMTSRYAHLMTGDLKRAANAMAQKRREEKQNTDKTNT